MSAITKEFTKEQLQQIEATAKEALWPIVWSEKKAMKHYREKITPEVTLELVRIALVALETGESEMLKRLAIILSGSDAPGEIRSLTVTAQSFVDRCKVLAKERDECRMAMLRGKHVTQQPELSVWYGSMPESNGKTNWTAILHRKGEHLSTGITIDRSEYPERVRYEADRVRYLIGESDKRPCIIDYDANAHSGYVEPVTTAYKLPPHVYRELVNALRDTAVKYQGCQQLREQISETLSAVITHTPHCNKAAPETSLFNDVVCCVCLGRHPVGALCQPGPIDHGYRAECECAGCKATARICAELAASAQVDPDCWCRTCRPVKLNDMRFVVCPDCGNKRCPHANDHRNACTGSNELGQEGSAYPASTQQNNEENAKSPSGIQTAPAQDSLPKNAEARCGNSPVIPDQVLSAVRKVARIRADFDDFDGDRRGIGDCLDEAEQELIVTINKYASVIAAAPHQEVK